MGQANVALGRWGEAQVARRYESEGYRILDRNWRVRGGELDLVFARGDEIVFCEVKTRRSDRFGGGFESVDSRKQHILRRTAARWLESHGRRGRLRFDVGCIIEVWIVIEMDHAEVPRGSRGGGAIEHREPVPTGYSSVPRWALLSGGEIRLSGQVGLCGRYRRTVPPGRVICG